jgi:hypothetical protein
MRKALSVSDSTNGPLWTGTEWRGPVSEADVNVVSAVVLRGTTCSPQRDKNGRLELIMVGA